MCRLSSIAEIRMGATLRGRDATRPVPSGSVRLIRIGDISQDGKLVNEDFVRIEPRESIREELFLRSGDVLFPNRGTRTTALAYRIEQPSVIVGAQFFRLRPMIEKILPEYLAWFLRTDEAANYFAKRRKGSYVQIIERKDLAELEIPLPPFATQQKIVAAADCAMKERNLALQLANAEWKLANGKLLEAARRMAASSEFQDEEHQPGRN